MFLWNHWGNELIPQWFFISPINTYKFNLVLTLWSGNVLKKTVFDQKTGKNRQENVLKRD